ncbi:MAG: hypothetical protein WAS73_14825 [Defluviicoccus sp.]
MRDPVDLLSAPPRWYKGVKTGEKISDVEAVTFANGGRGLRPYAPCHLSGQRAAEGTRHLRWIRRARFGGLSITRMHGIASETAFHPRPRHLP